MSKYTDDLGAALGIHNASMIGVRFKCPVIHYQTRHPHALGYRDIRAEITFYRDGKARKKAEPIRLRFNGTPAEVRIAHVEAAINWAEGRGLGVEEWVPSGFPNSWIPKVVKEQITAELKDWRKQQHTQKEES